MATPASSACLVRLAKCVMAWACLGAFGPPLLAHFAGGGQPQPGLSHRPRQALGLHDLLMALLHLALEPADRALKGQEHEYDVSDCPRRQKGRDQPCLRLARLVLRRVFLFIRRLRCPTARSAGRGGLDGVASVVGDDLTGRSPPF